MPLWQRPCLVNIGSTAAASTVSSAAARAVATDAMDHLMAAYGSESEAGGDTPLPATTGDGEEAAYDPFAVAEDAPDGDDGDEAGSSSAAPDVSDAQPPAAKKAKYNRLECPPGELPPPPPGDCDPELEARLAGYRAKNLNPTQQIRANRDFNNPMLLQKIVDYYGIDDVASNYPTSVFDPAAIVARRSRDKSKKDEPAPAASRSNSPRPDEPGAKD